ncbi:MAG: DUF1559 domain-containing protein [Planctomyces sp.]|nr:DUF1559 domain-containing protein [Planctomyces sp.]
MTSTRGGFAMVNSGGRRHGFSLIELLVAISVIAILMALLLPAVQAARAAARQVACRNNLRQIGLALHNYHDSARMFPPVSIVDWKPYVSGESPYPLHFWAWTTQILPETDQAAIFAEFQARRHLDFERDCGLLADLCGWKHPLYRCPQDPHVEAVFDWTGPCGHFTASQTSYFASLGTDRGPYFMPPEPWGPHKDNDGVFLAVNKGCRIQDVTDGASQTFLLGERTGDPNAYYGWWAVGVGLDGHSLGDNGMDVWDGFRDGTPGNQADIAHFWSMHPGGANFTLVDGSVRFISYSINYGTIQALATRSQSDVPGEF